MIQVGRPTYSSENSPTTDFTIVDSPRKPSWSFHDSLIRWAKPEARVKLVRVTGGQEPAKALAESLFNHGFDHPTSDTPPAMWWGNVDIGQVSITHAIRYGAGKAHKFIAALDVRPNDAPRTPELKVHVFPTPPPVPVGVGGKEIPERVVVQTLPVIIELVRHVHVIPISQSGFGTCWAKVWAMSIRRMKATSSNCWA